MKRLSSGIAYGPRWPVAALNALAPLARALGVFPKISDPAHLRQVEAETGRVDQSNDWIKEGRKVRLASFDQDAGLSLFGALAVRTQMRRCFRTTLEMDRIIDAHPEILREEIKRPLFVVGWPRTGTTLVQRLVCLHRDARYLPVWEAYSLLPQEGGKPLSVAERRRRAKRSLDLVRFLAPDIEAIHSFGLDEPDECYHLFRNYFAMPAGWDFAHLPSYWKWFDKQNPAPAYEIHKRQLQLLQWFDKRGHWALKSPQHLAGLPGLLKVYPDARIIYTHRDPVEAIASYCSLIAVAWGMTSNTVDLSRVAQYVLDIAARSQQIARSIMPSIAEDRIVHVDYKDFTKAPVETVTSIYDRFGYPKDPELATRAKAWIAANPAGRYGKHNYQLSDFGLTREDVERALAHDTPLPANIARHA